jgi:branched-chain amino acid transport system substrate-binding protein
MPAEQVSQQTASEQVPASGKPRRVLPALGALAIATLAAAYVMRTKPTTTTVSPSDAAVGECSKLSDCTARLAGKPGACSPSHHCVELASQDCEVLADKMALTSDETIWFGTLFPKNNPDFQVELRAVDLARQDFAQMMSGFSQSGQHVRPFGIVSCDDEADVMRAAHHLVDDVGVPAVIGFRSSAEVVDVASQLLIPSGVAAVVPLSTSPLVTAIPQPPNQPRLIWRTTFNSSQAAKVIGHFLPEVVEPRVRAAKARAGGPLRVALLRDKTRGGATWDSLILDTLRFNGKSVVENGDDFRRVIVDTAPDKIAAEASTAVSSLVRFAPDVVILSADFPQVQYAIDPIDRGLAGRPPYYLGVSQVFSPDVLAWAGASASRRSRIFGVVPLGMTAVNARFVMHFNESARTPVTVTDAPNSSYDSFYLLAYAAYAAGDGPITGGALSRAIGRLVPPGKAVEVGPAGIFDAFSILRAGGQLDLNGSFGSLDLSPTTGEAHFKFAVVCAGTGDDGRANRGIESGLVYSSESDRFEGAMRCP